MDDGFVANRPTTHGDPPSEYGLPIWHPKRKRHVRQIKPRKEPEIVERSHGAGPWLLFLLAVALGVVTLVLAFLWATPAAEAKTRGGPEEPKPSPVAVDKPGRDPDPCRKTQKKTCGGSSSLTREQQITPAGVDCKGWARPFCRQDRPPRANLLMWLAP